MEVVYKYPTSLSPVQTHYCPGCTHGIAHRLVAEVLDEMDVREQTIGVAPVGCSVFAYNYINCDFVEAAHGRAPAMATGIKPYPSCRYAVQSINGSNFLSQQYLQRILHNSPASVPGTLLSLSMEMDTRPR